MLGFAGAQSGPANPDSGRSDSIQAAMHRLEEGRTTLDVPTLNEAATLFTSCTLDKSTSAVCFYQLAKAQSYLKKAEDVKGHVEAGRKWLDIAISNAQKAISLDDKSANAHALLADLYGAKITGMFSGIQFGPKAGAETDRAFQLDPHNANAFAVIGRKYLYAPSAFGGNIDKAVEAFINATRYAPSSDEAFVWLAIAERKKGNLDKSKLAVSEALRLNPSSVFAKRVSAGIE
jgi:tetratricopeptide (TPR) repeat protein